MKHRLNVKEEELTNLNEKLSEVKSELSGIHDERNDWLKLKFSWEKDLNVLKDLNNYLQGGVIKFNRAASLPQSIFNSPAPSLGAIARSSPGAYIESPDNLNLDRNQSNLDENSMGMLRELSLPLYDHIKALLSDLSSKEITCRDASSLIRSMSDEIKTIQQDMNDFHVRHEKSQSLINEYKKRIIELENESSDLKSPRTLLQQVKCVIQSYQREIDPKQSVRFYIYKSY